MKGQNIKKMSRKRTQLDVLKSDQKTTKIIIISLFLYCMTKCPTEAEKIEYTKMS